MIGDVVKYSLSAPEKYLARRQQETTPLPYRTEFERDRDRILYSKEFRRLSGKTQVFTSQTHDHIRTRLTHTLEVSQISQVVTRNLKLNPILSEAISIGHDIGHTPFGHVGERTLSLIMNNCDQLSSFQEEMKPDDKGFKHNLQSLRVACDLEKIYDIKGLNLTNFTLWGIKYHSSDKWKSCVYKDEKDCNCYLKRNPQKCKERGEIKLDFYNKYNAFLKIKDSEKPAWSFEAYVVKTADEIAQRHHDIEDAIFMGIISNGELVERLEHYFKNFFDSEDKALFYDLSNNVAKNNLFLPKISKFIVNFLVKNLIKNSIINLNSFIEKYGIQSEKDFTKIYHELEINEIDNLISYPYELASQEKRLQVFLKDRILNSFEVQRMDGKGKYILRRIFKAYLTNPRQLHDATIYFVFRLYDPEIKGWSEVTKEDIGKWRNKIDSAELKSNAKFQICLLRSICDHLAGMTDRFTIEEYKRLYR